MESRFSTRRGLLSRIAWNCEAKFAHSMILAEDAGLLADKPKNPLSAFFFMITDFDEKVKYR